MAEDTGNTAEKTSGYVRSEMVNDWTIEPTPWQLDDDDDDDDDDEIKNDAGCRHVRNENLIQHYEQKKRDLFKILRTKGRFK
jgi:hypothetical protein